MVGQNGNSGYSHKVIAYALKYLDDAADAASTTLSNFDVATLGVALAQWQQDLVDEANSLVQWSTIKPLIESMIQGVIDAAKLAADNDLALSISNRLSQFNLDLTEL